MEIVFKKVKFVKIAVKNRILEIVVKKAKFFKSKKKEVFIEKKLGFRILNPKKTIA